MQTLTVLVFVALAYVAQGAPSAQIVGGKDAPVGKYPYQVSIRLDGEQRCGGSILDNRNILTAAHCFKELMNELGRFTIHAGTNFVSESGSVHKVANVEIHSNFTMRGFHYDIAVVHLGIPLTYTPKIQPIKLSTNDAGRDGKPCKMTGWGRLWHNGPASNSLQEIDLIVISHQQCSARQSNIVASQICTFTKFGEGTCAGDSGGPLVGTDGLQIGVASFVLDKCADGKPDVFTRVSSYHKWITAHLIK